MTRSLLICVIAALVAAAALMSVSSAGAVKYEKYIKVTPLLNRVDNCRSGSDFAQWSYTLKAKLARRNVERPASIRMRYEVTDLDTGVILRLQVLKLKPRGYYKIGAPTKYPLGHKLQFQLDMSYKSPINGKRLRSRSISNVNVLTSLQIDQANAAKPQQPPYPDCT